MPLLPDPPMVLQQQAPQSQKYRIAPDRQLGRENSRTAVVLGFVTLLLFGLILPRLVMLQLIEGSRNQELAEENRIRVIPEAPERGKILDRKGRLLANSEFNYSLFVWPGAAEEPEWPQTLAILSRVLHLTPPDLMAKVRQGDGYSQYLSRVAKNLSFSQVVALAERRNDLVGIHIGKEPVRVYPHGDLAAHVLGYIGEINEQQLDRWNQDLAAANPSEQAYRLGDLVGQLGVEYTHDRTLHGQWGGEQVEVNGSGQVVRILGEKPARAGQSLTLTLDLDVQKAAEKALADKQGAIVALDPRTGAVLAMASKPAFNPNWFSKSMSEAEWKALQGQTFPFVNRATQGFPPASTFKVITAIAGLESGTFQPNSILMTYPAVHGVSDWNGAGFGPIGFVTALQWSSNTFFGQVAVRSKPETVIQWAKKLGVGEPTGIDLPGEAAGFIPTPAWKEATLGVQWFPADSVMIAIGQGAVQMTPLQSAVVFAVPANGGYRIRPHLTDSAAQGPPLPLHLKPSTLAVLRQGMRAVVTGGTGPALNVPTIPPAAGKSGTGEDPPRRSHTWFGAFAPYDQPEIVVVAFGENTGGGGGSVAGPMTLQVLEAYFKHNPRPLPPADPQ
ncbi:penicillin-binding protein 2 [Lyngbya confervoides]|uniref:Penicillin-binding protein 2 n=1 Tax=Lyngbya confervoides BDU141951 TaxID=1574623 RepID=A0ABD4T8T6_9CYAN|nr:penicillin-binding protein 2 [Lyngbya confervoides]MCM1984915.1 penicillin-binding protein 2 [Lyngbya confervoides BDU141951]